MALIPRSHAVASWTMLITTNLAACRLGVAHERLLGWIARKLLPIAGEDEEGRVLLREHVVAERGEMLTAESPELLRSPRLRQRWADPTRPRVLPCGCTFSSEPDAEPLIRCYDARALEANARLADALAAAAPDDAFFRVPPLGSVNPSPLGDWDATLPVCKMRSPAVTRSGTASIISCG